jgi:hypothetical protein
MASSQGDSPWYAAYPTAKREPVSISRTELLKLFNDGKQAGQDFALIDLRRTDFEVRYALRIKTDWLKYIRVEQFVDLSTFQLKAFIRHFLHSAHCSNLLEYPRSFGTVVHIISSLLI